MSELSTVAPGAIRVGTDGQPLPAVDVRTADDGELLVRGPGLMRGYRHDRTEQSRQWTRTVGCTRATWETSDDGGYVRIIDRKKELIINLGGKNMLPSNIENHLKAACPLAGFVVAIGGARPFVVALIAPRRDRLYADASGVR